MSPRRADIAVPDQTGRLTVITGATSGNGLETARRLGFHGAEVVIAARNEAKAQRVVRELRKDAPDGGYRFELVDLASLDSVRAFAGRLLHQGRPISLLINNAGVLQKPGGSCQLTADGLESQWGTNYVASFLLTSLLLPLLHQARDARVVNIGSLAATRAKIDPSDFKGVRRFRASRSYANSKLAMLLFTRELQRRSNEYQWALSSIAAHPGWAATNLFGTNLSSRVQQLGTTLGLQQDARAGALPTLMAATDPAVIGGEYYGPTQHFGLVGQPGSVPWPSAALDRDLAAKLWNATTQLTGATWPQQLP